MFYILNDTIKDYRNKFFRSFEYRGVYVIKFMNMENHQKDIGLYEIQISFLRIKCVEKRIHI